VGKRALEGKSILTSKTKNLNELLLQKYENNKVGSFIYGKSNSFNLKVIEVINDIDFIEKAPRKIRAALEAKNGTLAVDMYLRAFDLVFTEKLAVFNAVTTMRNVLMECKQTIEDYLVEELESIIHIKVLLYFSKDMIINEIYIPSTRMFSTNSENHHSKLWTCSATF
jgi:exocyst complex component 4